MIHVSEPTLNGREGAYLLDALRRNQLSQGPFVARFEHDFADYVGAEYAVATSSGTTALHLALAAAGIGPGDTVTVPDFTFVATANAVRYTGARVRLQDVDAETWTLNDPDEYWWTIPVHLFGQRSEYVGKNVIEDSAECLERGELNSLAACYSFYGNKVISTGEGGMVVTNDPGMNKELRRLRSQAQDPHRRFYHESIGYNYRMTEMQAAVGLAQLEQADRLLERRREIAALYRKYLPNVRFQRGERACHWMVAIEIPGCYKRDGLMHYLASLGIETRPGFVPLHQLPMYRSDDKLYPVSTRLGNETLCLPTHANLDDRDVETICNYIRGWMDA